MSDGGRRFVVLKPDRFFPRDFEIIEATDTLLRIKTPFETFWVTRSRFDIGVATGVFRPA